MKRCTLPQARAACLSRVSTCDSRPLVSDALGLRDYVCFSSDCIPSKPAVVLSPGTPVPHKIQTPNVTLAQKFVTGVRSETHIKPYKFFRSFLTVYRSWGVSCSLLLLPSGILEVTLCRVDFLYKIQELRI